MNTFFTITAVDTTHCNDRSKRHNTVEEAIKAATDRIASGSSTQGVIIMQAIKLVTPKKPVTPVEIQDI